MLGLFNTTNDVVLSGLLPEGELDLDGLMWLSMMEPILSLFESSDALTNIFTSVSEIPEVFNYILNLISEFESDVSTPESVCDAASTVWYNESITAEQRVDRLINSVLLELAQLSPVICNVINESANGSSVENITSFERLEMLSQLFELLTGEDVNITEVVGDAITFLGQYEDVDDMCANLPLQNDTEGLQEFVNTSKSTVQLVVGDIETCMNFFDIFNETGLLPSSNGLCQDFVEGLNQTAKILGGFYTAASIKDVVEATCYLLTNETDSGLCYAIASIPREVFKAGCINLVSIQDAFTNPEAFLSYLNMWIPSSWYELVVAVPEIVMNIVNAVVSGAEEVTLFDYIENLMNVTTDGNSTSEGLCDAAATVWFNDSTTAEARINTFLDTTLFEFARFVPLVCKTNSTANENDLLEYLFTLTGLGLGSSDPFEVLGDVFSYLGQYENSDAMCKNA